jgi:hypothetical protein
MAIIFGIENLQVGLKDSRDYVWRYIGSSYGANGIMAITNYSFVAGKFSTFKLKSPA